MTTSLTADSVRVCRADYANPMHAAAVVKMLDAYAQDPMGGGEGLSDYAKAHLVPSLAVRPQAFTVLAFGGADGQQPIGLVNCIEGFSTFACRPLVNVHDVAVLPGIIVIVQLLPASSDKGQSELFVVPEGQIG